ncbi:MAG: hypothetical protein K2U26_17255 [Cyclobacteriaceae bacterium]|nr:hypothetical protein [Cyclobacteriaceae bacterium]
MFLKRMFPSKWLVSAALLLMLLSLSGNEVSSLRFQKSLPQTEQQLRQTQPKRFLSITYFNSQQERLTPDSTLPKQNLAALRQTALEVAVQIRCNPQSTSSFTRLDTILISAHRARSEYLRLSQFS